MKVKQFNRRSIRNLDINYSSKGIYFITICSNKRECLFGDIIDQEMKLNNIGIVLKEEWADLNKRYQNVLFKDFVVMPNHIHGILEIEISRISKDVKLSLLGQIIGSYKSICTNRIINLVKEGKADPFDKKVFQRNYHDHRITNKESYIQIKNYIKNNPVNWDNDPLK